MLDIDVTKSLKQLTKAIKKLKELNQALQHRKDIMDKIGGRQAQRWVTNFSQQGGQYKQWPALAESTVKNRGSSQPILVRHGSLWVSFLSQTNDAKVSDSAIAWNITSPDGKAYPLTHQFGFGPRGGFKSKVPARVMWQFDEKDQERAEKLMDNWITQQVKRHFG